MTAIPQVSSQFYSVEWNASGETVSVNNPNTQKITDADLTALAHQIAISGKENGIEEAWVYHVDSRNGHILVTLLDNTLVTSSSYTLFTNTVRYGGIMIVILCVIVWFTSGLLVRPLERNCWKNWVGRRRASMR